MLWGKVTNAANTNFSSDGLFTNRLIDEIHCRISHTAPLQRMSLVQRRSREKQVESKLSKYQPAIFDPMCLIAHMWYSFCHSDMVSSSILNTPNKVQETQDSGDKLLDFLSAYNLCVAPAGVDYINDISLSTIPSFPPNTVCLLETLRSKEMSGGASGQTKVRGSRLGSGGTIGFGEVEEEKDAIKARVGDYLIPQILSIIVNIGPIHHTYCKSLKIQSSFRSTHWSYSMGVLQLLKWYVSY